jgi:hypothetical protein
VSRLPMQLSWSPPPQLRAAQHAALELDRRTGLICSAGAEGPGILAVVCRPGVAGAQWMISVARGCRRGDSGREAVVDPSWSWAG